MFYGLSLMVSGFLIVIIAEKTDFTYPLTACYLGGALSGIGLVNIFGL